MDGTVWLFVPEVFWFWWNAVGAIVTIIVGVVSSLIIGSETLKADQTLEKTWDFDLQKTIILVVFFIAIVLISVNVPNLF